MKKKRVFITGVSVLLVLLYLFRIQQVNRQNDKTQIHYVSDDNIVKTANFEISVGRQILYETAALVAKLPEVKEHYKTLREIYRAQNNLNVLQDDKYILCVEVKVKNCSKKMQQINYTDFLIYESSSYHNGVDPGLFGAVNLFGGLSLRPGHSYTFWMPYSLNRTNIRKKKYENLALQDFSIMFSGYPNIQHMRLNHISLYEASSQEIQAWDDFFQGDTSGQAAPEPLRNTKEGTLVEKGKPYVQNSVEFTADSCTVTKNIVQEMRRYNGWSRISGIVDIRKKGFWKKTKEPIYIKEDEVDDEGRMISTRYTQNCYAVFVTLHVKNVSGSDQVMGLQPSLYNYTGQADGISCSDEVLGEGIETEKNSPYYTFKKDADTTVTFLYLVYDQKGTGKLTKRWNVKEKPLYLNFSYMAAKNPNIPNEIYSNGKFLQVK